MEKQEVPEGMFEGVISRYLPDPSEIDRKKGIARKLMDNLDSEIRKRGIKADTILVGSIARGTSLKNSDIDIFIRFSSDYSREELERHGLELGFSIFPKAVPRYAEHPYVSSILEDTKVDIVPCYRIEVNSGTISSVDRTPLHTIYMQGKLDESKIKEVVLLKLFLKRQGIYGSELRTEGFSGYVCELIILHFGSFLNFLEHISTLQGKLILDQREKRFSSPVVIVDPVDSSRNATAAVSLDSLSILKAASRLFFSNPDEDFFNFDQVPEKKNVFPERGTHLLSMKMKRPDIVDDILYPQMKLACRKIKDFSKINELPLMNIFPYVDSESITILMEFSSPSLPAIEKRVGPPAGNQNIVAFITKHMESEDYARGPYVEEGRIVIELRRKYTQFHDIFMENMNHINFGKNLNRLKIKSIISHNQEEIKKSDAYNVFLKEERPYLSSGKNLKKK